MRGVLFVLAVLLGGCASAPQGGSDANVSIVKLGVIESVTPIEMHASSGDDASIGGTLGQVGGASAGGGRGAAVGSILGSVIGGTLGHQSGIATKSGMELWVKLDGEDGGSAYVMQPGNPAAFKIGDRVRVVRKQGVTRVEPEIAGNIPGNSPENRPQQPLP